MLYWLWKDGKFIFEVEMLIDKSSVELFFDHGKMVEVIKLPKPKSSDGLKIAVRENEAIIHELEVYELKSAWNK